jgi:hypothetical protein
VSAIRDTWFGIGGTVPAIQDTHVHIILLVYCQARATPNDHSVQTPRLSITAWASERRLTDDRGFAWTGPRITVQDLEIIFLERAQIERRTTITILILIYKGASLYFTEEQNHNFTRTYHFRTSNMGSFRSVNHLDSESYGGIISDAMPGNSLDSGGTTQSGDTLI